MPSKTPKQKKFMAAVANSPKFAKKVGVPQSVGKEFAAADKAKEDAEEFDPDEAHHYPGYDPNRPLTAKQERRRKEMNAEYKKWLRSRPNIDDGKSENAEELPVGHYEHMVRLSRGGKWNTHTVMVRKTEPELIQKYLDQGFKIEKPPAEDYERFQNPYDDYVDDDAREQARRDDELMGDIKVDTDSIPKRPDLKRGMKDLDKKIKQLQFKDFFKKRNGK